MYKLLKDKFGKVECMLKTGNDFVKSEVTETEAENIISTNEIIRSDIKGYPIATDNGWYFRGATTDKKSKGKGEANA